MNKTTILIKEEVIKFLNESYVMTDNRLKFKEKINNPTFFNYDSFNSEFDIDIIESNIIVNWNVSFWLNEMGIENFIINVDNIEGTFTMQMLNKQTDEIEQETQKNINDFDWNFDVDDAELIKGGALYVNDLIFDFDKKNCRVTF